MSTHPQIANKLVMVDFDGTIVPWGPLMGTKEPFTGVASALARCHRQGYRIGIFTSRMSRTWAVYEAGEDDADAFLTDQYHYIAEMLSNHNVPFDFITAEKIPAEAYFDDKAIGVPYPGTLPGALVAFLNDNS